MRNILLTAGAGYIGSHIVDVFVPREDDGVHADTTNALYTSCQGG